MLLQDGATADEKYFSKNFQFLSLGAMAYLGEHAKAADLQSRQSFAKVCMTRYLQNLTPAGMLLVS